MFFLALVQPEVALPLGVDVVAVSLKSVLILGGIVAIVIPCFAGFYICFAAYRMLRDPHDENVADFYDLDSSQRRETPLRRINISRPRD